MELHILFKGCNQYQIIYISDESKALKLYSDLYNTKMHNLVDDATTLDLMRIECGENYHRFLVPSLIVDCYLMKTSKDKK